MAYLKNFYQGEQYEPAITVRPLDPRLQFPMCQQPLQIELPNTVKDGGRVSANTKCPDDARPWSVYVTAQVDLIRDVVVLASPITRGATLGRSDLRIEPQPMRSVFGDYYRKIEDVLGLEAKANLSEGTVVTNRHLATPDYVERGQRVLITASLGNFTVQAAGIAMNSAAREELVRVKNLNSGRLVEGIASAPGTVLVSE